MATSKTRAKAKLKKGMGRLGKMKIGNKESCESDASDLSQLRKPIDINLSSLRQITQLFEKGSDEVREILTYECDVIYECRICRSLFRSLANLISHKRVYCPEKYSVKPRKYSMDPTNSVYYKNNNNEKKRFVDFDYKENCSNARILRSQATRKEPKRDLTSVVDMLLRKQDNDFDWDDICMERQNTSPLRISGDNEQVLLEMMDSNQAMYQTILPSQISVPSNSDLMKTQTEELKDMSNRSTAVLGPDGHFHDTYSNIPKYGNQDEHDDFDFDMNVPNSVPGEDLTCPSCNAKFATKKTLTFHVKCKHMSHRMGFRCPCCPSTFTNRWSVYRHLFKVHRKSNEQVRRLRSQIQARAFHRETSVLEKDSESSEVTQQMKQESQNLITAQEWMENLELDTELQRCGACGKRFDRKEALMTHSQVCKKREANSRDQFTGRFKRARKHPPQRVGGIVEPPAKVPNLNDQPLTSSVTAVEPLPSSTDKENLRSIEPKPRPVLPNNSESPKETEIAIRVEDVSSLSKDVWDMMGTGDFSSKTKPAPVESDLPTKSAATQQDPPEKIAEVTSDIKIETLDIPEVTYTSIDNSRPVTLSVLDKEKRLGIKYRGISLPTVTLEKINVTPIRSDTPPLNPPVSSNLPAASPKPAQVDKKLSLLTNPRKLQCIPCNRKFATLLTLRRHIAVHRKRSRYSCKLCDFKAFLKCDFVAHCNKSHNARNNRKILSELIIEMPVSNVFPDVEAVKCEDVEKRDELEVIDVTCGNQGSENPEKQAAKSEQRINEEGNKNKLAPVERQVCTAPNESVKEKPRRGRPPKSKGKGGRKKKPMKKKIARKVRHVSPPALNEDFSESDEITNITDSLEPIEQLASKISELPRLRAPSRMDSDPELRKMVMEVIFGPAEKPVEEKPETQSNEIPVNVITVDENPVDDITIEQLETEVLDQPEDNRSEAVRTAESRTVQQITIDDQEDIEIQCDQVSLSNNNSTHNLKAVTFREDISIVRTPLVLGRKIAPNNCLVKLQTRDIQRHKALPNGVHLNALPSTPRENVHLIMYERSNANDKRTEMRQSDIIFFAKR